MIVSDFAFPSTLAPQSRDGQGVPFGLTKREYFAAMAMQGFCANPHDQSATAVDSQIATWSVQHADALLAELAKEKA